VLLPHLSGVVVEGVVREGDSVVVRARGASDEVACPGCATVSASVHGRYWRQLIGSAVAGSTVLLRLLVRRFRCRRADCDTVTFAEQLEGLTVAHARYSPSARRALTAVAMALAGRAGARLARRLGIVVGRDTMLKLLRAVPEPVPLELTAIAVDDFALRRGHVYATVTVNMLLTGRSMCWWDGRRNRWRTGFPGIQAYASSVGPGWRVAARMQ
jgi:transposase